MPAAAGDDRPAVAPLVGMFVTTRAGYTRVMGVMFRSLAVRNFTEGRLSCVVGLLTLLVLSWSVPHTRAAEALGQVAATTENARSTNAAIEQMQAGGNAVDAAVAAALVAGVTSPTSSGIGGGCFINYFDAQNQAVTILDARETAPSDIVPEHFESRPFESSARGRWVGVPGEVAGLHELHQRFGARSWQDVVAPAIDAARNGFAVSPHLARSLVWAKDSIAADPFLKGLWLGRSLSQGSSVKNPRLASTLERVANEGPKVLYEGAIAAEIVNTVRAHGGALSLDDLAGYRVRERKPLQTTWGAYEVYTMPPPSAGGMMLVQTLALYEKAELQQLGYNTPAYQHALAEAFRGGFADRMRFVGDPDLEPVPLDRLVSATRMQQRRSNISLLRTHAIPRFGMEEHGTHHLVTADANGNVVSLTTTVNRTFGAKLATPRTGIVLNDELDDFTLQKHAALFGLERSPNRPRPGARPVSSMTPTLVLQNGRVVLAAGGSGGLNIAPNVTQSVVSSLTFDLHPEQVLEAPRFQMPMMNATILVPKGTPQAHIADLERRGEIVGEVRFEGTAVQMLRVDGENKRAAADPRKFGLARVETLKDATTGLKSRDR